LKIFRVLKISQRGLQSNRIFVYLCDVQNKQHQFLLQICICELPNFLRSVHLGTSLGHPGFFHDSAPGLGDDLGRPWDMSDMCDKSSDTTPQDPAITPSYNNGNLYLEVGTLLDFVPTEQHPVESHFCLCLKSKVG
jgi:hypothetical protein